MITAIILARCDSSRLPKKHFLKIGDKSLLEITTENLLRNNLISEIYLGTGKKKENILFKKYLNLKYKDKVNIYFHKNSDNVTERIYDLTKKINTKYTLLISGDCCLIDNKFINRLYSQLNMSDNNFIKSKKKLIHEGITLFKTKSWKKVFDWTNKDYQKEHPGFVVNEYPKLFKISNYKPLKYELGKKFRLSVDTQSDLDFFNAHYNFLKEEGKDFNLENVINSKNFNFLNSHVQQKKAIIKEEPKITIITMASKKIGMGHFSRAKVLLREINETITSNVGIYVIGKKFKYQKFIHDNKIKFIPKFDKSLLFKYDKIIIDIPQKNFDEISNQELNKKNVIIIDNYRKLNEPKFIIPSIGKFKSKSKNIFAGKNYLVLSRDILKEKYKSGKNDKNLIFLSGSETLDYSILDSLKINNKKIHLIIGPLISNSEIKKLKKIKIDFSIDPKNIFEKIKVSKNIYCKFGVSALEVIALNKKPVIISKNESTSRMKDINALFTLGLIKLFKNGNLISKKKKITIDINLSLKNIIKVINLK